MSVFTVEDFGKAHAAGRIAGEMETTGATKRDRRVRACPFIDEELASWWFRGRMYARENAKG